MFFTTNPVNVRVRAQYDRKLDTLMLEDSLPVYVDYFSEKPVALAVVDAVQPVLDAPTDRELWIFDDEVQQLGNLVRTRLFFRAKQLFDRLNGQSDAIDKDVLYQTLVREGQLELTVREQPVTAQSRTMHLLVNLAVVVY